MSSGLSSSAISKLAADHRRLSQLPQNSQAVRPIRLDDGDFEAPVFFQNASSGVVPPYALMAVTGMYADQAGDPIVSIDQPSSTPAKIYLINGADQVQPGSIGIAQRGPLFRFAFDTSGTPGLGDAGWGPLDGQWTATLGQDSILLTAGTFSEFGSTYGAGILSPQPISRYNTQVNNFGSPPAYGIPGPSHLFSPVTIPDNAAYLGIFCASIRQNFSGSVTSAVADAINVIMSLTGSAAISLVYGPASWGVTVGYIAVPTYTASTVLSAPGTIGDTATTTLTPTWNYEDMGWRCLAFQFLIQPNQKGNTVGFDVTGTAVNGSGNSVLIAATMTLTPTTLGTTF